VGPVYRCAGTGDNKTRVSESASTVAATVEENSAATQQMSASAEEMSAQVQQVVASSKTLSKMAGELLGTVDLFKLNSHDSGGNNSKQTKQTVKETVLA